ncbi:hypothetical protein AVEN_207264-1 [Araneus ventricosus]|uniref:Uncharacterized protein n=1 Tax=Araneus ventricosus TaxID=182803 RepID=A0A4Y2ICG7_ARAVE|nr:hypothetical protein AVEN_207264-1 [Araneus ventricosus]
MLNLTSKIPVSKPDFIRDPSCMGAGTYQSGRRDSSFETDFIEIRLVEPGHVKSDVRRFQIRNLISSEILLVWSQARVNLTSKVRDSKPDFIRDPSLYGARYVKSRRRVPDSKPDFIEIRLV